MTDFPHTPHRHSPCRRAPRLAVVALALAPVTALAQQVHVLDDQNGQLHATDQTISDAALDVLLGGNSDRFDRPSYVVRDVETGTLTPIFISPKEYELVNNGDGLLSPPLLVEGTPPTVIDLNDLPAKQPDDLFSNDAPSGQPQDGQWQAKVTSVDVTGCPQSVAAGTMQGPDEGVMQIRFSQPMHPSDLSPGFAQFSWRKASDNTWHSEIVKMPAQQGVSAKSR